MAKIIGQMLKRRSMPAGLEDQTAASPRGARHPRRRFIQVPLRRLPPRLSALLLFLMACAAGRTLANGLRNSLRAHREQLGQALAACLAHWVFCHCPRLVGQCEDGKFRRVRGKEELRLQRCPCHSAHADEWGNASLWMQRLRTRA